MIFDAPHWTRILKRSTYFLGSVIGIYLAFKLSVFYMPFLIAFIISLLMEPAIKYIMKKTNLTRRTSSIIIFIIVFGIIVGAMIWGIITIISESTNLLQTINVYFDKAYEQVQNIISYFNFDKINVSEQIMTIVQNAAGEILNFISNWLTSFLTKLANIVTSIPTMSIYFGITIVALYFICIDKIYILDLVEHHMPKQWTRKLFIHIKEITTVLGGYLKAQATLIIISFIISVIGLYAFKFIGLNIEYPLLIALAIGFIDALPILGSGSVMIPWAIIASLNGDLKLGIAIIGLLIVMSIVRQFLEPRIVSKNIGIHPIFTLIAMYTGFKFIGVMGLILGPIILIILKNLFSNLIDKGIVKTIVDSK
ncbi:MAG: sporulation integral membrane protein YtvI [Clostridia bacterium]|nr:sporulation integral membrane protein YtvI [Clostridia bacterium]